MVLLFTTTLMSIDLAQYETFRAVCKFWQGGTSRYKGKGVSWPGNLKVYQCVTLMKFNNSNLSKIVASFCI